MRFSGEALYQRRLRKNMSRADLAVAMRRVSHGEIKATERGIRGWEKNEYTPHGGSVPVLAKVLDCDVSELYANGDASDDDEESDQVRSHTEMLAALAVALDPFHPRHVQAVAR